ncbi:MAG: hypothetical protein ABEJ82_09305 [Haloplanus sp.]
MVSRENLVVGAFVLASLPVAYAVESLTGPSGAAFLSLLVVGVVVPTAINERR